jgi:hypothetical protein
MSHTDASTGTGATSSGVEEKKKCYLARPDEFTGDNFEEWMLSANLFMRASKKDFKTDEDKILFVLSFMKKGLPAQFSRNFVEDAEDKNDGDFGTWAAFKMRLATTFEDKSKRQKALDRLYALKQGTQTAESFFQQFELAKREAQVDDENILVNLVEKAIPRDIHRQIYRRGDKAPATYELWKEKAIELDNMERRLKAFEAQEYTRPAAPRPLPTPPRQYTPAQNTAPPTPQWRTNTGTTYGGMGKPMDLAEAQRRNVCVKCGQPGHIGKWCPNKKVPQQVRQQEWQPSPQSQSSSSTSFDVRNLSYDEMKKMHDTWMEAETARQKQAEEKKTWMSKGF